METVKSQNLCAINTWLKIFISINFLFSLGVLYRDKDGNRSWDTLGIRLIGIVVVVLVVLGAACGYLILQASKPAVGPSPVPP